LVESDRTALRVLDKNLESLGIAMEIEVVRAGWPRALAQSVHLAGPFDIVFADPPYAGADYPAVLESLAAKDEGPARLSRDAVIVLEHEARGEIPDESVHFKLQRRGGYGASAFGFFRSKACIFFFPTRQPHLRSAHPRRWSSFAVDARR